MDEFYHPVRATGGGTRADSGAPAGTGAPSTPDYGSDSVNFLISPVRRREQFKYSKVLLFLYEYDFIPQPFAKEGHVQ
jgi:hypothetical protein